MRLMVLALAHGLYSNVRCLWAPSLFASHGTAKAAVPLQGEQTITLCPNGHMKLEVRMCSMCSPQMLHTCSLRVAVV